MQIEALEKDKKKLERKLAALSAKSSALKEANESQAVTLDGLQVTAHIPLTISLEVRFLYTVHYLQPLVTSPNSHHNDVHIEVVC